MKRMFFITMITALALAFIIVWAEEIIQLFPPPWPPLASVPSQGVPPEDIDSLKAEDCGECHQKQYEQWKESMHAQSNLDPIHQATLKLEGMEFCSGCHLPLAEQVPMITTGFQEGDLTKPILKPSPDYNPDLMSEGINCAGCHVREWVSYGPPKEGETEEDASTIHKVKFLEVYEKSEFCANCHQMAIPGVPGTPFINTYNQWKESKYAKGGTECQDCHMRNGNHSWKGGHSPMALKHAVDVLVKTYKRSYAPGDTLFADISLTNVGAGHKFPTGGSSGNHRIVTLTTSVVDANGTVLDSQQSIIRRQMAGYTPPDEFIELSDNRLDPGETRVIEYSYAIPSDASENLFLKTELTYALLVPEAAEAYQITDFAEKFPPTVIFSETKPLMPE